MLKEYISEVKNLLENEIEINLNEIKAPEILKDGMKYSMLNGGKRLRPILLFASLDMLNIDRKFGLYSAIAIEMIHTYSLVHDDLPSIDNDDYRRGILTTHKKFGEAAGLLIGDALLTHAFYIASEKNKNILTDKQIVEILKELSLKSGVEGMIAGQITDIQSENKRIDLKTLEYMHENKTAKLIKLPFKIASIIANLDIVKEKKLIDFAGLLGLAFQIKDDILDVEGNFEDLGKNIGRDEVLHKTTYVSLFGLEKSKIILEETIEKAKKLLNENFTEYNKTTLLEIADYIKNRNK